MKRLALASACIGALAGGAQGTWINFDSLGNNVSVTTQYAEATFSTNAGSWVVTRNDFDLGSSLPYYIISGPTGTINGTDPIFVSFTNPVNNLSFLALGSDTVGNVGDVVIHHGAGDSTVQIVGTANFFTPIPVSLTGFNNVTGIEITNVTDGGGLAFDDFTFDPVPEPATLATFGLGLAALARRRKHRSG